jgi:tetratricopeptide (TPR) repeat protein
LAEFDTAAGYYDQYNKEFPRAERRSDALFNSAVLRDGLGDYDRAIASFRAYVKENPKAKDAAQIAWRIGLILEKKKDQKGAINHFSAFSRNAKKTAPARALCADYKVVKNLEKIGKAQEADHIRAGLLKSYGRLPSSAKSDPCALDAAAHAAFAEIEPDFAAYQAISLAGKEKEIGKRLLEKLQRVDDLQKRYTKVLEIGQGDYGIASLYRIGFIYQHLAQAIFDTPCPRRLDEDQCMIYQAELQAKAFPLEEKAIEAYDKALTKAYELGLYNDWLAKAQEALKVYEPGRFPESHVYDLIASEQVFEVPDVVEAQ